jgi:hypothetical protein
MRNALLLMLTLGAGAGLAAWMTAEERKKDRGPAEQSRAAKAIAERAFAELKARYPEGSGETVQRDAHAKAHGCARAKFTIDAGLSPDLRVGTFAFPGRTYEAWVRFSNGAFEPGSDIGFDGRGMAVKILGASEFGQEHDLLMINHQVFFSSDAVDYESFANAGALTGNSDGLRRYFIPSANPFDWRLRQGYIAYRIASAKIESPLSVRYFSMTPFAFGQDRSVKYSAAPCGPASPTAPAHAGPNFLRTELTRALAAGPACFTIQVQLRTGDMPIDDVTREWSEEVSPFRSVGRLELMQQNVDTDQRNAFCEAVTFNPWRAPTEHQPQGSMNFVRREVYRVISDYRNQRNGRAPVDHAAAFADPRH